MGDSARPALSVVVVTAGGFKNVRRTLAHLRRQTIRESLEVRVVAENAQAVADHAPEDVAGFGWFEFVYTERPIQNVDRAAALAVPGARASHVALIEDHAYPAPEWAERIVEASSGEWGAIGPSMVNANPDSVLSWTNLLIAYGPTTEGASGGEKEALAGHNLAYPKEVLTFYGDRLGDRLVREGGLLDHLQERGLVLYMQETAMLAHANPSRLAPTLQLRFCAGRLFAVGRRNANDWTPLHRLIYTAAGPLIPFLRFGRIRSELGLHEGGTRAHLWPRVAPGLFLGLVMDALGQMAGYAFGPGNAPAILSVFEMDRMQHLNRSDRRMLSE